MGLTPAEEASGPLLWSLFGSYLSSPLPGLAQAKSPAFLANSWGWAISRVLLQAGRQGRCGTRQENTEFREQNLLRERTRARARARNLQVCLLAVGREALKGG